MMLPLVIAAYLIGMMVFLVKAAFDVVVWEYAYYAWDKSVGAGFVVWYLVAKYSRQRRIVMPVVWLAFSRFLWEIFSWLCPLPINHPIAVIILFMILTIAAAYACLNKDSNIAKFLDKNAP